MKSVSTIVIIFLISGCTSLKPIEMPAEELQEKISAGEIILVGKKARLITADGEEYKIEVTAVTDGRIVADDVEVAIEDVVAVETRQFSAGKTAVLETTGYVAAYIITGAIVSAVLLASW